MLKNITFAFPNNTPDSCNFFEALSVLLTELPNAALENESIVITASQPQDATPTTIFTQSNIPFPELNLGTDLELSLALGNFRINPDATKDHEIDTRGFDQVLTQNDALGEYYELRFSSQAIYRLSMNELAKRLKGHLVRIDHTGVNIPTALVSDETWKRFIYNVAMQTNLYKYPTSDIWPFILPATQAEYEADITSFPAGREPKFEIVREAYSANPAIQIDIETDLTRPEVEQLFPEPYGISWPDLADVFRSVFVQHEWLGFAIRFDIRFKNCPPGGIWKTGKWLVTDGGRIRPLIDKSDLWRFSTGYSKQQ